MLFLLVGCSDLGLPAEWELDRLRVLAVRVTPAEAAPGETVSFEALTVATDDHPVGALWTVCFNPFDCPATDLRGSGAELIASGDSTSEPGVFALEPGDAPTFRVPPDLLSDLDPARRVEGMELTFGIIGVDLSTGEEEWGRKGLSVSSNEAPNQNPSIAFIEVDDVVYRDGDTIVLGVGEGVDLAAGTEETAAEVYTYVNSGGVEETRTEELTYSWYTDIGSLAGGGPGGGFGPRSDDEVEGDWIAPSTPGEGRLTLVSRDGRGGTGWLSVDVVVQ